MELHQLEYLVAVAEEASFTKAAARVHVAQPGVSAQIRKLEDELGHELFDRSGRQVRLTEAGTALLPHARAALDAVAAARSVANELTDGLRGRIAVGVVVGCPMGDLADLLVRFHDEHPGVDVSVAEGVSADLVDGVRAGTIDLAVVGLPVGRMAGVEVLDLIVEPLVAAMAAGHGFSARRSVALEDLAEVPLIALPPGTGLRGALDAAAAGARVGLRIAFEAGDPRVLAQLAERGLGVAVLSRSMAAGFPDLVAVPLRPAVRSRLSLVWRPGSTSTPAARAFLEQAKGPLRTAFSG